MFIQLFEAEQSLTLDRRRESYWRLLPFFACYTTEEEEEEEEEEEIP